VQHTPYALLLMLIQAQQFPEAAVLFVV